MLKTALSLTGYDRLRLGGGAHGGIDLAGLFLRGAVDAIRVHLAVAEEVREDRARHDGEVRPRFRSTTRSEMSASKVSLISSGGNQIW